MGSASLAERVHFYDNHHIRDFVADGHWNQPLLRQFLPDSIVSEIILLRPSSLRLLYASNEDAPYKALGLSTRFCSIG